MKVKGIKWIGLIFGIFLCGCASELMVQNPLETQLATANFQGIGEMTYEDTQYQVTMNRTQGAKELILTSEELPTPIHFIYNDEGLTIQDDTLEGILLTGEKIPAQCIGVILWEKIAQLSSGIREDSEEGILVTLQDVGFVTATQDKVITGFSFPDQGLVVVFSQFTYGV